MIKLIATILTTIGITIYTVFILTHIEMTTGWKIAILIGEWAMCLGISMFSNYKGD